MATQAEVLRGMPVVEQVAARLNLHANPDFNPSLSRPSVWRRGLAAVARAFGGGGTRDHAATMPGPRLDQVRNAMLEKVQAALVVVPVKSSHVLQVSFTAQDTVLAAAAVNHAMDVYVKSQLGLKYGAVSRAHEWLECRAVELREQVRKQEDAIAQYRARNGRVEGMHAGGLDNEQISLLTENLARAQRAGRSRGPAERGELARG